MTLITSCRQNNYTGHKDDNNPSGSYSENRSDGEEYRESM